MFYVGLLSGVYKCQISCIVQQATEALTYPESTFKDAFTNLTYELGHLQSLKVLPQN